MRYNPDQLLIKFTSRRLQLEYFANNLSEAHLSLPEARLINLVGVELLKLTDAPTSRVVEALRRVEPALTEGYRNLQHAALNTPERTPSREVLDRERNSYIVTLNYIYLWWTVEPHIKTVIEDVTDAVYKAWSVFTWDVQSVTLKKLFDEYRETVISLNGAETLALSKLTRIRVIADEFLAELVARSKQPYADLQEDSIAMELENAITSLEVETLTL